MKVSVLVLMMLIASLVLSGCAMEIDGDDRPAGLRIEDYDDSSITLAWDKVSGADGYYIYLSYPDKQYDTASTSYRVTDLSNYTNYSFGVSAYKKGSLFKGEMESGRAYIEQRTGTRGYTVTFESNGGNITSQSVSSGGTASRPRTPSREGYTFAGWYTDAALTELYDFATPVRADFTLYAKWTALARYTVSFEWNNGSEPVSVSVYSGQTVSAPETPARAGYTFAGWYNDSSFTAQYDFSAKLSADITLYAKWGPVSLYTVSFNTNDGGTIPPESVYDGELATRPGDPIKTGYAFDGWYSDAALSALYDFSAPVTGNITLYAQWAAVCIVTFDTQGGEAVPAQTIPRGHTVTRPENPGKDGHTFDGWYREAVYNNIWDFNSDTINYDTALYAKWITERYTVNFEANGGSPAPDSQTVLYGDKIIEPASLTKTDYIFGGWYTNASFVNLWEFASNTVSKRTTLYAKWTAKPVVTFEANGGTPAPDSQTLMPGDKVAEPPEITRSGYLFGGWYKTSGFYTKWNFSSDTVSSSRTLYAKWTAESIEMVRVSGGNFLMGTVSGGNTDETPQHAVTVSSFNISKHEITQAQYQDIMGTNPSYNKTSGKQPVENVTWNEAIEFCNKLSERHNLQPVYTVSGTSVTADLGKSGYRLPTEAQWEYAAKGGDLSGNYAYAGSAAAEDVAWYNSNSSTAKEAGTKAPNELGLYDMSGNVREWCQDWYHSSYYSDSPSSNPSGPGSGTNRVTRGGAYNDSVSSLRSAARNSKSPSTKDRYTGFRVVCP